MATGTAGNTAREYHTAQVHYLRRKITWDNPTNGTTFTLGVLPPRASVVGGGVHIITAFNSTSSEVLDVGYSVTGGTTDADAYATDLAIDAVGFIALDELAATTNIISTSAATVTCVWASTSTGATAGEAVVSVHFTVPVENE